MKRRFVLLWITAAAVILCGCSAVLERSYESERPHTSQYWEDGTSSALRAEDYQSLVNGLLMLVTEQTETGVVRLYGYGSQTEAMEDMDRACAEVTMEDPMGAYLVDYITYDCAKGTNCYEFSLKITYQRTPAQLREMVSATTAGAVGDLLRTALDTGAAELAVKVGYMDRSTAEIEENVRAIMEEYGKEDGSWQIHYYPETVNEGDSFVLEITWAVPENAVLPG